jgi:Domain of unknown function (DUF4328)
MIKAAAAFATLLPLTRWIERALYLAIALSVIGVAFDLNEYRVLSTLHDKTYTDIDAMVAAATLSDQLMGLQGIADFLLQLFLYGAIGRWIYRAAWNVRHLAAYAPSISPGMAVGWYFIPFASLVMPFRAMREIWQGSLLADGTASSAGAAQQDGILRWWWALFLITSFIGNAILRITMQDNASLDTLLVKSAASIALDALAIPLDLVFIAIMRRVTLAQDSAAHKPVDLPELTTVTA